MIRALAFLSLALVAPGAVSAQDPDGRRSATVEIADHMTPVQARAAALVQIQREAAGESGTFLEARAELRDGELKEAITEVIAATVELSDITEAFSTVDGRPALVVTARALVDRDSVERRVAALGEDDALRRQILQLARENASLENALVEARRLDVGAGSDLEHVDAKYRTQRARLDQNRDRVRALVIQLSPAIAEAQNAELRAARLFATAEAEIEERYFSPLLRQPIRAELQNVRRSVDGASWMGDIVVSLDWNPLTSPVCTWFECKTSPYTSAPTFDLRIAGRKQAIDLSDEDVLAYWSQLAGLMMRDKVILHVCLGAHSTGVPLLLPARPSQRELRNIRVSRAASTSNIDHRLLVLRDAPTVPTGCPALPPPTRRPYAANETYVARKSAEIMEARARAEYPERCRSQLSAAAERWDMEYPVRIATLSVPKTWRSSFTIPAGQGSAPPALVAEIVRLPFDCTEDDHPACAEQTHASYHMRSLPGSDGSPLTLGRPVPVGR